MQPTRLLQKSFLGILSSLGVKEKQRKNKRREVGFIFRLYYQQHVALAPLAAPLKQCLLYIPPSFLVILHTRTLFIILQE